MPAATVTEALAAAPLEACVKKLFELSWNDARRAIASGKIRLGDNVCTDGRVVPGAGSVLHFVENAPRPKQQLSVLFEDESVIVVDKPSGLLTVPFDDAKEDSLDARVRAYLSAKSRGPRNLRPELGVVHRIDKETSGLVLFTRTWPAKQSLAKQFREHTVHRRYVALVAGVAKAGTIVTQIGRDRGDGKRGSVERGGERAITHVEVLQQLTSRAPVTERSGVAQTNSETQLRHNAVSSLQCVSLVACRLETGRTHQIRIHLSERGTPVLGDHVYGNASAPRLMLHAKELGFTHPSSGKDVHLESPLPADMQAMLDASN